MKLKLFGRTLEIRRGVSEMPPVYDDGAWAAYLSGRGYALTPKTALQVAAVFRCVDLVSKTMASLPLHLYEKTDTGKEKAKTHPLYDLIYALPNHQTTAYEFWQMFVANLLLSKGGFAKIERNSRGRITALWNIPSGNVSGVGINPVNGERYIDVVLGGGQFERLREYSGQFMYVPNFLFSDKTNSENPLSIAADVLGLTGDLNRYASATFGQGVNPGGYLECPQGLSQDAYERLKSDFQKNYSGVVNAGKFIILEQGMKANVFQRDLEKTQALESRKFAIAEICRIFGVPPHLCMDMEHATFSNIEQQSLEFVRDAINPLSVRLEQAMYRDLLSEPDRKRYFAKFNTNGLMRGDTAARTQYYNTMHQNGIMNADEIRELEDMNHQADGQGELFFLNGNMITRENAKMNVPKGAQKSM